jgi:hypothetical protein
MLGRDPSKASFYGVALALIILGAAVFALGLVGWLCNYYSESTVLSIPSVKVMGGAIITALGYILLELEMIRKK